MNNIKVVRSKRKTVSIQVNEDCQVIVRAPQHCSDEVIHEFVNSKKEWLQKALICQENRKKQKVELNEAQILQLKRKAQEYLPERIEYYSRIMGVSPSGFRVTSARKRFGSCNTKGSLCFSYMLMMYPDEAIDYVVVHELAHIRHHNHQKDFYEMISQVMPDYKAREKMLK